MRNAASQCVRTDAGVTKQCIKKLSSAFIATAARENKMI
jgi:hypothetical protein